MIEESDPPNPEIIDWRETLSSSRFGPRFLAEADASGNANDRARIRLSYDTNAQVNALYPDLGGYRANGVEVRVKIEF